MRRIALAGALVLAACAPPPDNLDEAPAPIVDFRLGHAVAVAPTPHRGPFSRSATPEELASAVEAALVERLSRHRGDTFYHVGVSIEGYVLAKQGIPFVMQPKSFFLVLVSIYDDVTGARLTEEPVELTVFEPCCNAPGIAPDREAQISGLAFSTAREVERLMAGNPQWFTSAGAPQVAIEAN